MSDELLSVDFTKFYSNYVFENLPNVGISLIKIGNIVNIVIIYRVYIYYIKPINIYILYNKIGGIIF